jgi:hypothetical protein
LVELMGAQLLADGFARKKKKTVIARAAICPTPRWSACKKKRKRPRALKSSNRWAH